PAHLLDVLPTLLRAAGAPTDDLAGVPLQRLTAGEGPKIRTLCWEHEGNRAIRRDRWKMTALRGEPWALFDLKTDRTETRDLAAERPKLVQRLAAAWDDWAAANRVTPVPADYGVAYLAGGDPEAPPVSDVEAPLGQTATPSAEPPRAVGPMKKLAGGFKFTEGPAWDGTRTLYFSDLPNKTLHRWTEADGVETLRTGESFSNGIDVDAAGALAFCEVSGRIVRRTQDGTETALATRAGDQPLGPTNDLWIGPDGAVYFTLPKDKRGRRAKRPPPPDGRLYATVCRIDPKTGAVRDLDPNDELVNGPNGIVGSADGKRLFLADPAGRACWAYDLAPDGSLSNRRKIADRGSDGLTLDDRGNLYVTGPDGVLVFSPAGEEIALIKTPERPANMTFGGLAGRTLFITARTGLYAVAMNVRGDGFPAAIPTRPRPPHRPDEPGSIREVPPLDSSE
ncbi:MAG: SMP-30/gluconolactonase/LRE family protein, partial [Planctomycetota bacterium]